MTTFPNSPRLVKGGIVLIDADSGTVRRVIALQYNPESLSRTLQAQTVAEGGDRSQALRLTAAPVETLKLDATIDATDQLEFPSRNPTTTRNGIAPQLAALEAIIYPSSTVVDRNNALASVGTLEIAPMEAPLTLFVWSEKRVLPVRLTEFSINEEAFDPALNPIRAKVSLGLRVLGVNDLGFDHRGGTLSMLHHRQVERLSNLGPNAALSALGLPGIPS
jgi:hypothetical protein